MATFWFETCVEGYFWWKLPVGRQFKSLEEYSPLHGAGGQFLVGLDGGHVYQLYHLIVGL